MDARYVPVMRSEDLSPGTADDAGIRQARLGDSTVLLARLQGGDVVAFAASCPHQATDLELAELWDGNVRCARHNYLYDPRTGENIQPSRDHRPENLWKLKPGYLPTYPVVEHDGWIHVGPVNPAPPSYDPALEIRPTDAPHTVDEVSEEEAPPTEALRVAHGTTFELRLPMSPLPGYTWEVEVEGPVTVLAGSELDATQPELLVQLSADAPGSAVVRCGYSAPWDAEPSEFRHYRIDIEERGSGR